MVSVYGEKEIRSKGMTVDAHQFLNALVAIEKGPLKTQQFYVFFVALIDWTTKICSLVENCNRNCADQVSTECH